MASKARETRRKNQQFAEKSNTPAPRNGPQKFAKDNIQNYPIQFLVGPPGTGKAQPLNAVLYSRVGPIKMGDIRVGDEVANVDGGFSKVIGVYPQGEKQICRVHFTDGTFVDACEEHFWQISHHKAGRMEMVVTTATIEQYCHGKGNRRPITVQCPGPVEFEDKTYLIDPYTVGILLSEGNLTNANVAFASCESEVVERVRKHLMVGLKLTTCKSTRGKSVCHLISKEDTTIDGSQRNPYKTELVRLGMWGKYSYEKSIPEEYKHGSVSQRTSLLQGMMDGDGCIDKNGAMSYSSTSKMLIEDFAYLVRSLGGSALIKSKQGSKKEDGTRHRTSYNCHFKLPEEIVPVSLKRKVERLKPLIRYLNVKRVDRVERLGTTEMQCIAIDHPKRLYLTDHFTVTHNTHCAISLAWDLMCAGKCNRVVITRPVVACGGEQIGHLPGDLNEKMSPWLAPILDCLTVIIGDRKNAESVMKNFEFLPMAHVRGRSFLAGTVAIVDEIQNLTAEQLYAYMTRYCDGSYMFLCGDPSQSDLRGGSEHIVRIANRCQEHGVSVTVPFNDVLPIRSKRLEGMSKAFAQARTDL